MIRIGQSTNLKKQKQKLEFSPILIFEDPLAPEIWNPHFGGGFFIVKQPIGIQPMPLAFQLKHYAQIVDCL